MIVHDRAITQNVIDTTELTGSISHEGPPELLIPAGNPDESDGNANLHGRGAAFSLLRLFHRTKVTSEKEFPQ
ncbi:MAG: hypothetical protein P8J37_18190 [Fuerstiella sp.]|nr:hypothetical protein [Fuerstiella sp.]